MEIIIFEDSQLFGNELVNKIEEILGKISKKSEVVMCTSDLERVAAFAKVTKENAVFFLDICVGELNEPVGLELAERIKQESHGHIVVFVTNFPDTIRYDIHAKINAFAFILKSSPIFDTELEAVLQSSLNFYKRESLIIKNRYCLIHSIRLGEIHTIETVKGNHKVGVYHDNGYVDTYETLGEILKNLSTDFFMCNRSCIVNLGKISLINKKKRIITTRDNRTHDISMNKMGAFLDVYNNRN